jgi:hypothetical protein
MSTSIRSHRSKAFVKPINQRGRAWKPDPITNQFRFVIRMAVACNEHNVPYVLVWGITDGIMSATITASGNIPMPKPLPKPPKPKPVQHWKPSIVDAVYQLDAYHDSSRKKSAPGFIVEHSSGLSLVHPSDSGELGVTAYGDNEDIREKWFIIHTRSGLGFGITTNFRRAINALLLAVSCPVDWTQDVDALKANPEFRKAGYSVQAEYARGFDKDSAHRRLEELERAA